MIRRIGFRLFRAAFRRLFGTRVARLIWLIPGSHAFHRQLVTRLTPPQVWVDGHLITRDSMDSLLLGINGTYEPIEQALFVGCIRPGDTVVDVGAHIGLYTLQAARAVGPDGSVHAFEPNSENFLLLEANIEANGYENVSTSQKALSNVSGFGTLTISEFNTGDHSLGVSVADGRKVHNVDLVTLDEYFKDVPSAIHVFKMDVQGAEPAVLAGGLQTFAGCNDLVLFTEFSPMHLANWGGGEKFLELLAELGFELFEIDEAAPSVTRVAASTLLAGPSNTAGEHTNLVCVKGRSARTRLDVAVETLDRLAS